MGSYTYDKAATRTYSLKFNRKTDAALIDRLDSQDNIQRYIKSLILADIEREMEEKSE